MLNRVNNQHIQTNSISFKSVLMHNKNAKAVGQLRYKTAEKIHYTQTATKTILAKIGENFLPEKFQKVLKEQNINIRKGIEILLASGALITLFSKKNKEGNDNLEVKIVDEKNSQEDIYIFDTGRVTSPNMNGEFYTQAELDKLNLEQQLSSILDELDEPLLKLRQAQLIPHKYPTVNRMEIIETPEVVTTVKFQEKKKAEPVQPIEEVKPEPAKSTGVSAKRNFDPNKIDTSKELDRLLKEKNEKRPFRVMPIKNSDIGTIDESSQALTREISNLIKELCDIYNRDPHIVNSLKTRTETFDTMRKQGSIFLKDIGDKKQRFFITIPKTKRLGDDILLITIQNSDYSHNDAIAINGDKINRVVDSYQKKGSGLSNYVSRGKFLTQKEVRLKNINPMLQEIKNELQKLYELVKSTYTISPSLEEKINLVETRLAALKTKAQASKYRTDLIPRYKLSPYVIKNINSSGDFINYIPGDKNPFFPNVSIIERRNYLGELQERFAFDKKGFIENYPSKTIKNVPKKIIYMSKSEVSERNLDTNLRKYITKCLQEIDIINENIDKMNIQKKKFRIF